MKIINFRGDLTENSAKKEALVIRCSMERQRNVICLTA